jgi:K+-transporting ATPase ATPase C chain
MSQLRPALVTVAALTLLTGFVYPLAITGIGAACFPRQAHGSLIVDQGRVLGSRLIGQFTEDPKYFWGRLSATGAIPNDADNSGGSNLGPGNEDLAKAARARVEALRKADPGNTAPVPSDLVTASGSGLDPHITPAAAEYQVVRVARVRGRTQAEVRDLVRRFSQGRVAGLLGEPRVDVLELNLALDGKLQ